MMRAGMAVWRRRAAAVGAGMLVVGLAAGMATAQVPKAEAPKAKPDEKAKGPEPLTPVGLAKRLSARLKADEAKALAEDVRRWFGAPAIARGAAAKVDGRSVAWAIEAPGASEAPEVVSEDGEFRLSLTRIGDTDVYATAATLPNGFALRWAYRIGGKTVVPAGPAAKAKGARPKNAAPPQAWAQLEVYDEPAELSARSEVARGKLIQPSAFPSKVFEGTTRDWWIYVPAAYKPGTPAAVMVFQDGGGYKDFVPTAFDNLIAEKAMPVTVGVFVNPGTFAGGRSNRSFEYDTLSDQYARFLLEEVLPETEKAAGVTLRRDAAGRAIAGISSGGICAWTVAWERPNEFSKVLSWVGSFTNIASGKTVREGGHNYEALIRKTPKKPIRVFLQDGANDLDNNNGNWPLANQQMAKSLEFAQYDFKFVYGRGFHSNRHGRAILPESLRWLWRGWEAELPK